MSAKTLRFLHGLLWVQFLVPVVLADKHANKDTSQQQSKSDQNNKGKSSKPPANSVLGRAYGYWIDVSIAGSPFSVGPRPLVNLPATGGSLSASEVSASQAGLFSSPSVTVMTSGDLGANNAVADSAAIIDDMNLAAGLITARQVTAFSSSFSNGTTAASNDDGTEFVGMSMAGVELGDLNPPPNSAFPLPGVGVAILNEQTVSGNGAQTTTLTVNCVQLIFDPLLQSSGLLSALTDNGVIDPNMLADLLDNASVDGDLLDTLGDLGLLQGLPGLPEGRLTFGRLNDLLGGDLVQQLLDQDALDQVLDQSLPGGLLNIAVLQALQDSGELDPVLTTALNGLGDLDGQTLDTSLLEELSNEDVLTLADLERFLDKSEYDFSVLDGQTSQAWAESGVTFYAPGKDSRKERTIHGAGTLGQGEDQAQFELDVEIPQKSKQAPKGHLHYHDRSAALDVQSRSLTSSTLDTRTGAVTFSGFASINGAGSYTFTAVAQDVSPKGTGHDTFSFTLNTSGGTYTRSGTLTGGSLHLHNAK